jgi:hypothetical protein
MNIRALAFLVTLPVCLVVFGENRVLSQSFSSQDRDRGVTMRLDSVVAGKIFPFKWSRREEITSGMET